MPASAAEYRQTFYQVQKRQFWRSIPLFLVTLFFYFIFFSLMVVAGVLGVSLFAGVFYLEPEFWFKILGATLAAALFVAAWHFHSARRHGAEQVIQMLTAHPPDPHDQYHKQYQNLVDELRLSAGLPEVECLILPSSAVNSLALMRKDGTPIVCASEGMLAELNRDELQAAAAHEIAHIIRGDAFFVTLLCSLAGTFERIARSLVMESGENDGGLIIGEQRSSEGFVHPLVMGSWLIASTGALLLKLLTNLISREREVLADSVAVELTRHPAALASAIYKSQCNYSFMGDFTEVYGPLFIVNPNSSGKGQSFLERAADTHPPLMKRLKLLSAMAGVAPTEIIGRVWESKDRVGQTLPVVTSIDERDPVQKVLEEVNEEPSPEPAFEIRRPDGSWDGPFPAARLIGLPFFTPAITVRDAAQPENMRRAIDFEIIRTAVTGRPSETPAKGNCPRCSTLMRKDHYEGVPVLRCGSCGGVNIRRADVIRVLTRRGVRFSDHLMEKARRFASRALINPEKLDGGRKSAREHLPCPVCGAAMRARPFNYQFFLLIDECYGCRRIWFDGDELEILQILVEKKRGKTAASAQS